MAPMAMNFAALQHSQPDVLNGHGLLDMDPADQALPLADRLTAAEFRLAKSIRSSCALWPAPNPPTHPLSDDLLQLNTGSNHNDPHVKAVLGALHQGTVE